MNATFVFDLFLRWQLPSHSPSLSLFAICTFMDACVFGACTHLIRDVDVYMDIFVHIYKPIHHSHSHANTQTHRVQNLATRIHCGINNWTNTNTMCCNNQPFPLIASFQLKTTWPPLGSSNSPIFLYASFCRLSHSTSIRTRSPHFTHTLSSESYELQI